MCDIRHAQSLYELASHNIDALQAMADNEIFADEIFGFQAQQGVEKVLKSWLSLIGLQYSRSHDLQLLIQQLEHAGQQVPLCFHELVDLNDFAVQFRYEVFDDEILDRSSLVQQVLQCLKHVETLLQKEVNL